MSTICLSSSLLLTHQSLRRSEARRSSFPISRTASVPLMEAISRLMFLNPVGHLIGIARAKSLRMSFVPHQWTCVSCTSCLDGKAVLRTPVFMRTLGQVTSRCLRESTILATGDTEALTHYWSPIVG